MEPDRCRLFVVVLFCGKYLRVYCGANTSLLTAYYCSERGSDQAQAYLAAQSNIAISGLTEAELISALSKKVRARDIAAGDARKIAALALRENIILRC